MPDRAVRLQVRGEGAQEEVPQHQDLHPDRLEQRPLRGPGTRVGPGVRGGRLQGGLRRGDAVREREQARRQVGHDEAAVARRLDARGLEHRGAAGAEAGLELDQRPVERHARPHHAGQARHAGLEVLERPPAQPRRQRVHRPGDERRTDGLQRAGHAAAHLHAVVVERGGEARAPRVAGQPVRVHRAGGRGARGGREHAEREREDQEPCRAGTGRPGTRDDRHGDLRGSRDGAGRRRHSRRGRYSSFTTFTSPSSSGSTA